MPMNSTVQARLDPECQAILSSLVRRYGWTPSQALREGLRLLAACQPPAGSRRIAGQGRFRSGIPDLGSDKAHLEGFGR